MNPYVHAGISLSFDILLTVSACISSCPPVMPFVCLSVCLSKNPCFFHLVCFLSVCFRMSEFLCIPFPVSLSLSLNLSAFRSPIYTSSVSTRLCKPLYPFHPLSVYPSVCIDYMISDSPFVSPPPSVRLCLSVWVFLFPFSLSICLSVFACFLVSPLFCPSVRLSLISLSISFCFCLSVSLY